MSTPKAKPRAAKSGFSASERKAIRASHAGWYARQHAARQHALAPGKRPSLAAKRGRRPRCPQCGGPLGHSTAIIAGGAMRVVGGRPGRPWVEKTGRAEMFAPHEAIGFLRLVWHREMAPDVTIVDAAPCGQFDLYLCSILCLRSFMTARIDDLEKLAKKESGAAPR
jgi:hypothetical protein